MSLLELALLYCTLKRYWLAALFSTKLYSKSAVLFRFVCGKCTSRTFPISCIPQHTNLISSQQPNNDSFSFPWWPKSSSTVDVFKSVHGMHFVFQKHMEKTYENSGMHINPTFVKTVAQMGTVCPPAPFQTESLSLFRHAPFVCLNNIFSSRRSSLFICIRTKLMWDNGPCGVLEKAESNAFWR